MGKGRIVLGMRYPRSYFGRFLWWEFWENVGATIIIDYGGGLGEGVFFSMFFFQTLRRYSAPL